MSHTLPKKDVNLSCGKKILKTWNNGCKILNLEIMRKYLNLDFFFYKQNLLKSVQRYTHNL